MLHHQFFGTQFFDNYFMIHVTSCFFSHTPPAIFIVYTSLFAWILNAIASFCHGFSNVSFFPTCTCAILPLFWKCSDRQKKIGCCLQSSGKCVKGWGKQEIAEIRFRYFLENLFTWGAFSSIDNNRTSFCTLGITSTFPHLYKWLCIIRLWITDSNELCKLEKGENDKI